MSRILPLALVVLLPTISYSENSGNECRKSYNTYYLYGAGGATSKDVSLKIYSKLKEGVIVDHLGIWEMSSVRGREISLGKPRDVIFGFWDEHPDQQEYQLKIDEKGSIEFGPLNDPSLAIKTSVNDLRERRKNEAATGCLVALAGTSYRILPQGGTEPAYLCFPAKSSGELTGESPGIVIPAPGWIPGIMQIDGSCSRSGG